MAARWFLTYYLKDYGEGNPNRIGMDYKDIDTTNKGFFDQMREAFGAPDRAFKSVGTYYKSDMSAKKEAQTLDSLLERASGTWHDLTSTWKGQGELVLKGAALAMAGETAELVKLVDNFPRKVVKIVSSPIGLPPPKNETFQLGYARVGNNKEKKKKKCETVVIIAPQDAWWDEHIDGKHRRPIHTKDGWRQFFQPDKENPITAGRSFPMTNLAQWLPQVDKYDPWVFVEEDRFW